MTVAEGFLGRIDKVEARLDALLRHGAGGGLTPADARTGERWDGGQVWAHVVELVPYWIDQVWKVQRAEVDGTSFGRTVADPGRIAAIERDRHRPAAELEAALERNRDALRSFLGSLVEDDWLRAGTHPTVGRMSVEEIVERFLVGHLEEHAAQLEELVGRP